MARNDYVKHEPNENPCGLVGVSEVSILDELKSKRARLAQEHNRRIKKLDREISQLEQSGAEDILRSAKEVLYEIYDK